MDLVRIESGIGGCKAKDSKSCRKLKKNVVIKT